MPTCAPSRRPHLPTSLDAARGGQDRPRDGVGADWPVGYLSGRTSWAQPGARTPARRAERRPVGAGTGQIWRKGERDRPRIARRRRSPPGRQAVGCMLACTAHRRISCQRLRSEFGTTLPRFDPDGAADREAEGLSMGELSARLMVTGGNVTGIVTISSGRGTTVVRRSSDRPARPFRDVALHGHRSAPVPL